MLIDKQKKQDTQTKGWKDWMNKHKRRDTQIDRLGDGCMDRQTN